VPLELADRVTGEDVGVGGELGSGGERRFERTAAVGSQQLQGGRVERDRPPGLCLGLLVDRSARHLAERAGPADGCAVEVDVRPAERAELATAATGQRAEAEEDGQGPGGLGDHADNLGRRRRVDVRLRPSGALHLGCRVANDETQALRPVERGPQDVVHPADRPLGQPSGPELGVELLHVDRAQALDRDRADVRVMCCATRLRVSSAAPGAQLGKRSSM
jgi:hypothetical protein